MQNKKTIAALSLLMVSGGISNGVTLAVSNVQTLFNDTLYATESGTRMNSGSVSIGYFSSNLADTSLDTIDELIANRASFTIVSTTTPGNTTAALGMDVAGFADNSTLASGAIGGTAPHNLGQLLTGNALIGRQYYSLSTDAASFAAATNTSQFALVLLGTLPNEDGGPSSRTTLINGLTPILGSVTAMAPGTDIGFGSVDGGLNPTTYSLLRMESVTEPSTALIGALGAIALLRRRRN